VESLPADAVRPDSGRLCFDALPGTVERLLTGDSDRPALPAEAGPLYERRWAHLLLIYVDAFGWRLYEQLAAHPLFARLSGRVQLTSQFPSTTTAHVTTIHTGLPVGEHGLYEWFVYEPELDRLICPLWFAYAGDAKPGALNGALDAAALFPADTIYRRLAAAGVASAVAQPASFTHTPPNRVLLDGAAVCAFRGIADAAAQLRDAFAAGTRYGFLYIGELDTLMHLEGPASPQVVPLARRILTALERHLFDTLPVDTLVLLTSDHGMAPIAPETTLYLNRIWPELERLLRRGADGKPLAPAGSPRDVFLHTDAKDEVIAGLRERLAGRAHVADVAALLHDGLFGPVAGRRLRERVGDVVVLPSLGECAYWHEPGRFAQSLRGMHGSLDPVEMLVPLLAFAV
jgi:hypothetical protein